MNDLNEFIQEQYPDEKPLIKESPISANIRGYYKGFSIQITCRDSSVPVKPLLEKMVTIADAMDQTGWKPSWNEKTNGDVSSARSEKVDDELTAPCKVHDVPMKQGWSKAKNKAYWYHDHSDGRRCFGKGWMEARG